MNEKKPNHWIEKLISFLGFFIFLLGIYASLRTGYNLIFLKNNYPTTSVINLNPFPYSSFEEDCYQQFNYPYFDDKGRPRKPYREEQELRQENIKNCLKRIEKQRRETKINDIWISFFLLFFGGSIIIYSKKKFTI